MVAIFFSLASLLFQTYIQFCLSDFILISTVGTIIPILQTVSNLPNVTLSYS